MNRFVYADLIGKRFGKWISDGLGSDTRSFLIQDHERCLWTHEPREAMRECGVQLLEGYPKCSQDLNPIETAWKLLRDRLDETVPLAAEPREQFIKRLRRAVGWINEHRAEYLMHICNCQKEWAKDVLDAKGCRTKH